MATAVQAARPAGAAARPRREREEEVLVWPDLLFPEFIAAVVFTMTFLVLSTAANAPLLEMANSNLTPNPSKAPWYFLNLQELLLHMNPALAGVIVPTVAILLLMAVPYFDGDHEGQGVWFGTPNAVKIMAFSAIYSTVATVALILYDSLKFDQVWQMITGHHMPAWAQGLAGIQHGIQWPSWSLNIPYLPFNLHLMDSDFRTLDFPYFLSQILIPIGTMAILPLVLIWICRRWDPTRRGAMVAFFTGFMASWVVLTVIGTAFRGEGLQLLPVWDVWNIMA